MSEKVGELANGSEATSAMEQYVELDSNIGRETERVMEANA
jgi:hypothetical protein